MPKTIVVLRKYALYRFRIRHIIPNIVTVIGIFVFYAYYRNLCTPQRLLHNLPLS